MTKGIQKGEHSADEAIRGAGLSEKAARLYRAGLEIGETTLLELAKRARIKRTTAYYVLGELIELGAVVEVKRGKRQHLRACEPSMLLKRARERLLVFEEKLPELDALVLSHYKKPGVYFFHGPSGFKSVWDRIFESREGYRIITEAQNFLDFVSEKYIIDEIIKAKRIRKIQSMQLITDSPYARAIVKKDSTENRVSKFLPKGYELPYTEVIGEDFTALISPRPDDMIIVIESTALAKTRRSYFDILWRAIP
ncbi:MAG: hypothetical protein KBD06_04985 [Candidatus Pacebacteria bacterium]|nr:hypothetical protein [Candidatus Paceibacterota bacterium]